MKNTKTLFCFLTAMCILLSCSSEKPLYLNSKDEMEYINKVNETANWQIKNFKYSLEGSAGFLHDYGIDAWTNSTFLFGLATWTSSISNLSPTDANYYYKWLNEVGSANNWSIPDNFKNFPKYSFYHADELCIAQFYLKMYKEFKNEEMLSSVQERCDWIIENYPDTDMVYFNKQAWTWCDALFMAPPVYAELYAITGNKKYLEFMHTEFQRTYNHLYNKEYKLFYRDSSYFTKQEANGKPVFWGRGNGWVAAGLVNVLKTIPNESPIYSFYLELYKDFIPSLVDLMDPEGYWHASLLDPESYNSPETSASALITYAMAYGINHNLLDKKTYLPKLKKCWSILQSFVNEEGKLGWIQPIGADPKNVTKDMSSVYGVGAYLLAATEIMKIEN